MGGIEPSGQETRKKPRDLRFIAMVVIVVLLGSLVVAYAYLGTNPTNPCVISGQPAGMFLRIVSDSGTPVASAQVTATHKEADVNCGGVLYTGISVATSFTTNGNMWYALDATNAGTYSFGVIYSGHAYDLSAQLEPVSVTCATLYVPSGRTNVTSTEFETTC